MGAIHYFGGNRSAGCWQQHGNCRSRDKNKRKVDTLRITVTAGDGLGQAIYMLQCTVTDGTGATATIQAKFW